jgi:pimeloyl-ACP methyl ester carboxylesterase
MGPVRPRTITYVSSGITFTALEWGPPDGPLALGLHGYPDTAWTWRHLGPYLADIGWRVVAPFTRGYGPTGLATDGCYQVGALAHDAIAAHRILGGDGRAVLIGHDWGAITAYAVGSAAPGTFARIVTLAVPPLLSISNSGPGAAGGLGAAREVLEQLPTLARQLRRSWYMGFQQLPRVSERSLPRLASRLWADWSPGYDAAEDVAHFLESVAGPGHSAAVLGYYRAMAQPWRHSSRYAAEQAHWLGMPTDPLLYLHGLQDGCLLAEFADRAAAVLPPETVALVPGAGHFLHLENPAVVNELIADFITQ